MENTMKRYIKTKTGKIYDTYRWKKLKETHSAIVLADIKSRECEYLLKAEIRDSDDIKDLCDEFIWIWNKREYPYSTARQYERFSGFGDLMREVINQLNYGKNLNTDYQIRGAVWTDEGLTYVAKAIIRTEHHMKDTSTDKVTEVKMDIRHLFILLPIHPSPNKHLI